MSIEGQCHFFTIYFPGFVSFFFTRPRYQVSVYRTIGPLAIMDVIQIETTPINSADLKSITIRPIHIVYIWQGHKL